MGSVDITSDKTDKYMKKISKQTNRPFELQINKTDIKQQCYTKLWWHVASHEWQRMISLNCQNGVCRTMSQIQ